MSFLARFYPGDSDRRGSPDPADGSTEGLLPSAGRPTVVARGSVRRPATTPAMIDERERKAS